MKFLSNIYDPTKLDAKQMITKLFNETQEEAWQRQQKWLADKVICGPQATDTYTVSELKSFGMVGVYAFDGQQEENENAESH